MAMSTNTLMSRGYALGGPGIGVAAYYGRFDYAKDAQTYYRGSRSDEHIDMVQFAKLEEGDKFLDIGCGPGLGGFHAAKLVGRQNVRFGDLQPSMIEVALENFSTGYGVSKNEIRSQFYTGNIFEDNFWAKLDTKFDVIFARRFVNQFEEQEKVLQLLLDHITSTGRVVFDFMPNSPAYEHVPGEKTMVAALRWLHSFPKTLQEAGRGVKVEVSHMEILMTALEMEEVARQVRELAWRAGADILATRRPTLELPSIDNVVDYSNEFWEQAKVQHLVGIDTTQLVKADFLRRAYVKMVKDNFNYGAAERMPHPVMYSVFVSLQKKARGQEN